MKKVGQLEQIIGKKEIKLNLIKKYINIKNFVEEIIKGNAGCGVKKIKAELKNRYKLVVDHYTLAKLLIIWSLGLPKKVKKKDQT